VKRAAAVLVTALVVAPSSASAVPDCPSARPPKELLSGQGRLESIIGDARGRLYYTDLSEDRLLRLNGPGQQPTVVAEGMKRPGGMVFEPGGKLVVGFSGGPLSGVPGNGMAGIFRLSPDSGAKKAFVEGIDQANGVARARDGSLFTSNDIANEIVRVSPSGAVERHWSDIDSPNGLVIDRRNRYLFAAQTFTPAKISRFELDNPEHVTTFFEAPEENIAAGLDGLTRDGADRLYAAANGGGEVWRVDADGKRACALARGLTLTSAVGFGGGGGFDPHNLYAVTFQGRVFELPRATDRPLERPIGSPRPASKPRLRLSVRPRRTRAGRRTRFRVRVTSGGRPVSGVTVRLGRKRALTNVNGRARLVVRFHRARRVRARASRSGYRSTRIPLRVMRAG
jgi:sugar lactone lactonase YvrE